MANVLDLDSTNTVTLKGLKNKTKADGDPLKFPVDATVVLVELLDAAAAPVAGVSNVQMPYVSGTGLASVYRGVIPHTVTLVAGTVYTARVRATVGTNVRMFNVACTAQAG